MLINVSIFTISCVDTDNPTPVDYTPLFHAMSIQDYIGGIDVIELGIKCSTDDIDITTFLVEAPDGTTYTYSGGLYMQNELIVIPDTFVKLVGSWNISISGEVSGGTYDRLEFVAITSTTVNK